MLDLLKRYSVLFLFLTGQRLTSYGGYLTYTVFYTTRDEGYAVIEADVIIGGSNGYIVHNSVEQPPSLVNWKHSVRISEDEFTNLDGSAVTRDQFMNILINVTSIYIRATYWHEAVTTRYVRFATTFCGLNSFFKSRQKKEQQLIELNR